MTNLHRTFRFAPRLFLALCLCLPVVARALEFRVLSWSGSPSGLRLSSASGSWVVPLEASEDVLSAPITAPGGALTLLDSADAKRPLATLLPPPDMERAILVLAPNPGEGEAYRGLWLDDSPEARPENSITLHNFSSTRVALQLGSEQTLLSPGDRHVRRFAANERSVMILAAIPRDEGWTRVISSPQPVKNGFRILVILRDGRLRADGSREPLDRVTFYDYKRPTPATPAAP